MKGYNIDNVRKNKEVLFENNGDKKLSNEAVALSIKYLTAPLLTRNGAKAMTEEILRLQQVSKVHTLDTRKHEDISMLNPVYTMAVQLKMA